jgi:glycosyltransferase involved in cell wall biosynthesis
VNIFLDNVNIGSTSGPNSFAKKLSDSFLKMGHEVSLSIKGMKELPDVQLSFIASAYKIAPIVQRLDGIYFNIDQDFNLQNKPIEATYWNSEAVIFQSEFNKKLTEKFFGVHKNPNIIRNGTDILSIESISPMQEKVLDNFEEVWCCASSWRPHKRLSENIRYFLENASDKTCLVIAGENPDEIIKDKRIFYAGSLSWENLISLYKRSQRFIHLSWLDHCPNVVVDARASGCKIVCSSSGGTQEIAGIDSVVIEEDEWDLSPCKLYKPPKMDFSRIIKNKHNNTIDIVEVSKMYEDIIKKVIS